MIHFGVSGIISLIRINVVLEWMQVNLYVVIQTISCEVLCPLELSARLKLLLPAAAAGAFDAAELTRDLDAEYPKM